MLTSSSTRNRVTAALVFVAMPVGAGVLASPAAAARFSCVQPIYRTTNSAVAACRVEAGHIRLRVNCKKGRDAYSPAVGPGTWILGNRVLQVSPTNWATWYRWAAYTKSFHVQCNEGIAFSANIQGGP